MFSAVIFSGCATVFTRSTAPVEIESTPSGASVYAMYESAEIFVGKTPLTARIPRECRAIKLKKEGYEPLTVSSGRSFEFFPMILDVIFWPTLIVDAYTGRCYSLQSEHQITLEKVETPKQN